MSILKRISKSTIIIGIGAVASFALNIFLSRLGGPVEFGQYVQCIAWSAILTTIIEFASEKAFAHFATHHDGGVQHALDCVTTIRVCMAIVVTSTFALLIILNVIAIPWQTIIFIIPVFNLGMLFEVHGKNVEFAVIIFSEKVLLLFANLIWFSFFPFGDAVYIIYGLVVLLSLLIQANQFKSLVGGIRPKAIDSTFEYIRKYFPLLIISISQLGYGIISRLIIEFKFDLEVFANVTLAFQVVALSSVFQSQIDRVFRPLFIQAVFALNIKTFDSLVLKYLTYATLPMLLCTVVVFAIAPTLMGLLYGLDYSISGQVLRYISPLLVTVSLMRLADMLLISFGLIKQSLSINVAASFAMLLVLYNLPSSVPLMTFMFVIIFSQMIQILAAIFLTLHKRMKIIHDQLV